MQKGFVESSNGRLRYELLNHTLSSSILRTPAPRLPKALASLPKGGDEGDHCGDLMQPLAYPRV
jgi:hypothetical protein